MQVKAEVSVDKATGKIKVHNYWIAIDGGLIIQPDNVNAQLESAVIYALSGALSEELSMKDGAVQQSNFNDYHVLRMSDMPELHIKIMPTDNPPTGMGEVGIPCVAPAIGNAELVHFALSDAGWSHEPPGASHSRVVPF